MKSSDEAMASYLKKLYRFIDYRTPPSLHDVIFLYNRKHKRALISSALIALAQSFTHRGNRLFTFRLT